ncbi:hypothetical protein [Cupriavidus sp. H39]|uniref:hypothetical protein n=1 Tax=Cupriavidus sp. H39 TaxID=3401635 RepID=UPI003D04DB2A
MTHSTAYLPIRRVVCIGRNDRRSGVAPLEPGDVIHAAVAGIGEIMLTVTQA